MKKFLILLVALLFVASGCGKKAEEATMPSEIEGMVIEIEPTPAEGQVKGTEIEPKNKAMELPQPVESKIESVEMVVLEKTSAVSVAKPSVEEIQKALKNAGLYQGKIDGILGSKTKKAIVDFQTQNNLKPDGKVGPKTWDKLKGYLNVASTTPN